MKQNYFALCFLRFFRSWKTTVIFFIGFGLILYLMYEKLSTLGNISYQTSLHQTTSSHRSQDACLPSAIWERRAALDHHENMIIQWNVSDTYIKMMVTGKTKGWIGIGFSPNATMVESDLVIGWVKEGIPYLQDRFAYNNDRPIIDDHNDYELICATETESHTSVVFIRKLNTCDNQDFKIKNFTMRIIWAMSNEDPSNPSFYGPAYHGRMRGSKSLFLLDFKQPKPSQVDTRTVDLLIDHVEILDTHPTMTWCRAVDIPEIHEGGQIVGYEPIVQDNFKGILHHILLYSCWIYKTKRIQLQLKAMNCVDWWNHYQIAHCDDILLTWVVGSEGEFYPPHVGYSFETSEDKLPIFMLEMHYNNANGMSGLDNSGIRLYLSQKSRPNSAGIMVLGHSVSYYEIIPPHLHYFMTTGVCPSACLQVGFPEKGIRVFGLFNHGHSAKTFTVKIFRNGIELEPIVDEHYDPTYEQAWFFKKEIEIYPGDSILVECAYDTRDQNYTRIGGLNHLEEMCLVYLQYYPVISVKKCLSSIFSKNIHELLGVKSINNANFYLTDPHRELPLSYFKDFIINYNWTIYQTNTLQSMNFMGPFIADCVYRNSSYRNMEAPVNHLKRSQNFKQKDHCQ